MLSSAKMKHLFGRLNEELKKKGELGEIGIVGGAVMCLVFEARQATRDVDAIFAPAQLIRELSDRIGEEEGLGPGWLNDAAKGYLQNGFLRQDVLNLSNLRIWAPDARYMLAMKCISARWDTSDRDDVIFLIKFLNMKSAAEVLALIENYYPKKQIPSKTQFFITEVFDQTP